MLAGGDAGLAAGLVAAGVDVVACAADEGGVVPDDGVVVEQDVWPLRLWLELFMGSICERAESGFMVRQRSPSLRSAAMARSGGSLGRYW